MIIWTLILHCCVWFIYLINKNQVTGHYIGCYNTSQLMPYLEKQYKNEGGNMTVTWCLDTCRNLGQTFAVLLHDPIQCGCSNIIPKVRIPEMFCNITCNKNSSETKCGMKQGSSVHAVCSPGFYGSRACHLECPGHCASSDSQIGKSCNVLTGDCVDGCEPGWTGQKCLLDEECDYVKGNQYTNLTYSPQHLIDIEKVTQISPNKILLFPHRAFNKEGMVSKIKYFAESNGTVYLSIWNILKQSSGVICAEYCGKIHVKVISGLHVYNVPDNEKIVTNRDYCIGIHYPRNTVQAAIPLLRNTKNPITKNKLYSAIYTNAWFKIGAGHKFTEDKDIQHPSNTSTSNIQVAVQVYAQCNTSCQYNMFGESCDKHCGRCNNGIACHIITGVCPNECDYGWTGELCDTPRMTTIVESVLSTLNNEVTEQNQTRTSVLDGEMTTKSMDYPVDESINVTIGLGIGVALTLILLVAAIVGFTRCEIRKRGSDTTPADRVNKYNATTRKYSQKPQRERLERKRQHHRSSQNVYQYGGYP